ncbi:MAG: hypothetical protein RBS07_06045 [Lentimicrobium sp.]|nr:hypothetical protein [Lentimicrobium sp.]
MNYSKISEKGRSLLLWIYTTIAKKFMNVFNKLRDRFPLLNRYPLLKYLLIPLLITMFFLIRYVIKLFMNELVGWSSSFVGEVSGYYLPERAIGLFFVAIIIILRFIFRLRSQKMKKNNELELSYESAK